MKIKLHTITTLAICFTLLVVVLGAYTRLTDAGLGCPDWPGCYGHLVLPGQADGLSRAQSHFPDVPIEASKAWTEMVHRYAAGTLGVFILFIFSFVFLIRRTSDGERLPRALPACLVLLVVFQALLGMWTVTLKLLPVVVMGHLLGGMLIFSCLCYFRWQLTRKAGLIPAGWRFWTGLGVVIVFLQIALGGWVSSNYAGIACIGFPQCNGVWVPALDWVRGFNVFLPIGENYQGGLLDNDARVTVQVVHRLGAVITAFYVLGLSGILMKRVHNTTVRWFALLALCLVAIQFLLGVINVVYLLPLWSAVAHNGVAALLMASMLSLFYLSGKGE